MKRILKFRALLFQTAVIGLVFSSLLSSTGLATQAKIRDICKLRGQETNTLSGFGLVVGLNGTGQVNNPATMRAMARAMKLMGMPVSPLSAVNAESNYDELKKNKNVMLVMVQATIPATGAARGTLLDCTVSAPGGKSLEGGRLMFAALKGPNLNDSTVYALCNGSIQIDSPTTPLSGHVHNGCKMEEDVFTPFVEEKTNTITLEIDSRKATFQLASNIVDAIVSKYKDPTTDIEYESKIGEDNTSPMAHAVNATTVVVRIPNEYQNDVVTFVSEVMQILVFNIDPEPRVTITKSGLIVLSGDVTVGPVLVQIGNTIVESSKYVGIKTDEYEDSKLNALVAALNKIKVPRHEMVEVIKAINDNGRLSGKLIIK